LFDRERKYYSINRVEQVWGNCNAKDTVLGIFQHDMFGLNVTQQDYHSDQEMVIYLIFGIIIWLAEQERLILSILEYITLR